MTVLRPVNPVYFSYIPKPLLITSRKNKRIVCRQTFPSRDYPKLFTVARPPGWFSRSKSHPGQP
jgi:hypothetical protein